MAGHNAFGTALERSDMAPTTPAFTAISNVTTIGGPELSRETIDVTAHDSAEAWMEFVGGLKDAGEVSLEVNYDPASHDLLVEDLDDTEPRDYRIKFPVTPVVTWAFKALLTEFSPEAPYDDKLTAALTFKVSGKPTITTGP